MCDGFDRGTEEMGVVTSRHSKIKEIIKGARKKILLFWLAIYMEMIEQHKIPGKSLLLPPLTA